MIESPQGQACVHCQTKLLELCLNFFLGIIKVCVPVKILAFRAVREIRICRTCFNTTVPSAGHGRWWSHRSRAWLVKLELLKA
jgi:hypothetical protein